MSGPSIILFTQEQVRTLTGVSAETIRHWRKAVPYLAAKSGKSARFTFADIVGLAITREFIATLGVQIGNVHVGVNALFHLLAETHPALFQGAIVTITASKALLSSAESITIRAAAQERRRPVRLATPLLCGCDSLCPDPRLLR